MGGELTCPIPPGRGRAIRPTKERALALANPSRLPDRERLGERRSNSSLSSSPCSGASWGGYPARCSDRWRGPPTLRLGSGVAFPKSRLSGWNAGHAG
jgi:hypothetical protein